MKFQPGQIYHVFNQGNNRQPIFFSEKNYWFFLDKMKHHLLPFADLICYCLMPNHFHWLLVPNEWACQESKAVKPRKKQLLVGQTQSLAPPTAFDHQENLSQAIAIILGSYTRAVNKQEKRSGSLFRPRTKVKDGWRDGTVTIDGKHKDLFFRFENDYALECFQYIHLNPVKASLVPVATDWAFSSAREYAGLRGPHLCNLKMGRKLLRLQEKNAG